MTNKIVTSAENKVIGIHNGIKYIVGQWNGQDADFYYSTKSNKTAMSIRGLARMLDCDVKLIQRQGVSLGVTKEAELLTGQGIQGVSFIIEDNIVTILKSIIDSKRIKKETKANAQKIYDSLAQAGFRLMVLLEVAPEVVAIDAIKRIDSKEAIAKVDSAVDHQKKYIDTYHGVHNQLKEHGCKGVHHATYNKQANAVVGIEDGSRHKMTRAQELEMLIFQSAGEYRLMLDQQSRGWDAVNSAVDTGKLTLKSLAGC